MIEGPGHMAINEIEANMQIEKRICKGAPFYVLGPLVTDIGAGYDHISGAIGGAVVCWCWSGYFMLCNSSRAFKTTKFTRCKRRHSSD